METRTERHDRAQRVRRAARCPRPRVRLLLAVVCGLLLAGVAACGSNTDADVHRSDRTSFAAPAGGRLTIRTDNSRLTVRTAATRRIGVKRWSRGWALGGSAKPGWRLTGRTLRLTCHSAGVMSHCAAHYEVRVPSGLALTVRGDNSRVEARGLRLRDVRVRVGDGSVALRFATAPRRALAAAHSGAVSVSVPDDGAVYRVRASTGHGFVRTEVPEGEADVAGSGSASAARPPGTITARTGHGTVRVTQQRPRARSGHGG